MRVFLPLSLYVELSLLSSREEQLQKGVLRCAGIHARDTGLASVGEGSESVGEVPSSIGQSLVFHSHLVPHSRPSVLPAQC